MNILVDCKRIGEEFLPLSAAIQQPAHSKAGLRFAPVGAGRVVYTPFRSLLDKRSTFHFGRCWTRATGTQQHWRLATQARSAVLYVSPTAQLALIPSCRQMSAHPDKRACPDVRPLAELS